MEIDQKTFFRSGIICFLIIGSVNLINYYSAFEFLNFLSKISQGVSVIFNFIVAGFFYYLLKNSGIKVEDGESEEELKKMVEGLNVRKK